MKIAQITPYFFPHTGGVERYVYNLSKNLINEGHVIEVITSNVPEGRTVDIVDGIPVRRLKCIGEPLRNPLVPSIFLLLNELEKFDVIHVHNLYSSLTLSIPLLKKFCKVPLVLTHHGRLVYGEPMKDTCVKIYEKSIKKIILKFVDSIVALSESDAQYILSSGELKRELVEILPNAINPADFMGHINADTTEFIARHHLEGRKRILFVGEVTNRKGIPTLIRSVPLLIKKSLKEEVVFVIVGSGENLSDARALARDLDVESHVVFTGRLSFVELMQAYCSADLFVLPSLSEGLPTTILEAMYFGLPVVSTNIPGVRDHFSGNALLVPPNAEFVLSDALLMVLEDEHFADMLSRNGRELVLDKYTWDKVAGHYESLYSKVMLS